MQSSQSQQSLLSHHVISFMSLVSLHVITVMSAVTGRESRLQVICIHILSRHNSGWGRGQLRGVVMGGTVLQVGRLGPSTPCP